MSQFKIQKHKQKVDLKLKGAETLSGYFFLNAQGASHEGPDRVLDMLQASPGFVPFETHAHEFWMVNTEAIESVVVDSVYELEVIRSFGDDYYIFKEVLVQFVPGHCAKGNLVIEPQEGFKRVQDELNRGKRFVILDCGDRTHLIATSHVATVVEV